MEDIVRIKNAAIDIVKTIDEHNGEDSVLIDITEQSSWTRYFIISTVTSSGHLRGLVKHVKAAIKKNDIPIFHWNKKISDDNWALIDCGDIVIHLMDKETREFYELEKLWFSGEVINYSN